MSNAVEQKRLDRIDTKRRLLLSRVNLIVACMYSLFVPFAVEHLRRLRHETEGEDLGGPEITAPREPRPSVPHLTLAPARAG